MIVQDGGSLTAASKRLEASDISSSETDDGIDVADPDEIEIRRVLARADEAGHVDAAEVEMIERVFELNDTAIREVMVPRPDIVSIPDDRPLQDLRTTILDAKHTRYPVVEADDPDRVVGFVDVKDVLRATEAGDDSVTAGDLARDIIVVPEMTTASDLLVQFRDEHRQMAAVIDEWGVFEGIATVEDIVEAVIGDLRDEFDVESREHSIRTHRDGVYEADGAVPLSAVNTTLGTSLEGAGYETLGGLILDELGREPEPGDTIAIGDYRIEVSSTDGARISTVRIVDASDTVSTET